MASAACARQSPAIWHELAWSISKNARLSGYDRAMSYCLVCPVRARCLEYAMRLPSVSGVFGGYDPVQIKRMKESR